MIFNFFKKDLLKVYSHPRSGTHFLEAFLAKNFYQDKDLSLDQVAWGHWSNRKVKEDGNSYGKLFGHHFFPSIKNFKSPGIYIIRDGRAVAYSIWKTPNFLHKDIDETISFSDFLNTPLDWTGSPSKKTNEKLTIFEHWAKHCDEWIKFSEQEKKILIVHYEDLIKNPYKTYLKIKRFNFKFKPKLSKSKLNIIKKPTGLLPNKAKVNSWSGQYTESELKLFKEYININSTLVKYYG
ncbi:Sulfotransferase domain-containing protein [Psychroflexus salarius]|uniref:Sulfotransferase domain-containing protein n=1 Tax=Psychroflexus salarius TaxID=1155689 RepID=A0A1M4X4S9_9FLAO|nr:sulfotransferase domain-containing protein [Psychroflexus salarius]SHE88465.1 Sulfotransferase domain-containing protein [Psychroflexus salarius]